MDVNEKVGDFFLLLQMSQKSIIGPETKYHDWWLVDQDDMIINNTDHFRIFIFEVNIV